MEGKEVTVKSTKLRNKRIDHSDSKIIFFGSFAHAIYYLFEAHRWLPSEYILSLGGIATELNGFIWANKLRVNADMFLMIQPKIFERKLEEIGKLVRFSSS